MSSVALAWALDARETGDIGDGARLVLLALADHAHADGSSSFPSKATLSERLGKSERTIQRYLADLRDAGLIFEGDQELVSHVRADRRPTVYDLDLDGINRDSMEPRGVRSDSPDEGHGETDGAPRGDRSRRHGESDLTPEPRTEPTPETPPSKPPPAETCPACGARFTNTHACRRATMPAADPRQGLDQTRAALAAPPDVEGIPGQELLIDVPGPTPCRICGTTSRPLVNELHDTCRPCLAPITGRHHTDSHRDTG